VKSAKHLAQSFVHVCHTEAQRRVFGADEVKGTNLESLLLLLSNDSETGQDRASFDRDFLCGAHARVMIIGSQKIFG
jgi:hypothetical protein